MKRQPPQNANRVERDNGQVNKPLIFIIYWPFPSSKTSHFQNEAKYKSFLVKMSFNCMRIKTDFHINGFALSVALKQSLGEPRK